MQFQEFYYNLSMQKMIYGLGSKKTVQLFTVFVEGYAHAHFLDFSGKSIEMFRIVLFRYNTRH